MKRLLVLVLALFIIFGVSMTTVEAGEAILSWDPPTTNADGTPLTDLAGYKVYRGMVSGVYSAIPFDVGNVTSYTFSGLSEGTTYYYAITAYDASGNESAYSNEVNKTMPQVKPSPPTGCTIQ